MAGRDTTAILLTWLSYFVSLHPEVEKKVNSSLYPTDLWQIRDEIASVVGDEVPSMENTKKLKYVQNVMDETLRFYPPAVPFNSKLTTKDTV